MKFTIKTKLVAMAIISILTMCSIGLLGMYTTKAAQETLASVMDDTMPNMTLLTQIEATFLTLEVEASGHMATKEPTLKDSAQKIVDASYKKLNDLFAEYSKLPIDEKEKQMLEIEQALLKNYMPIVAQMMEASRGYDVDAASNILFHKLRPVSQKLKTALDEHNKYNKESAETVRKKSEAQASIGSRIAWIAMLSGTIILLALGVWILKSITGAVKNVETTINKIGKDLDFTIRIPVLADDEIGSIAKNLNTLLDQLQVNLNGLKLISDSVATTATLMATASEKDEKNAQLQNNSASEMAATMEELSVSITHVGEQAENTHKLTKNAGALANTSAEVVIKTINDINDISAVVNGSAVIVEELQTHSGLIKTMVKTIHDISDQTNLLALNAAIEAARAGEQGRGFAVVADEVRKLAERTSKSTDEISKTVNNIQNSAQTVATNMFNTIKSVKHTVERASGASEAMHKMNDSSSSTLTMVANITDAIKEQSSASLNVAKMVEQIAQMAEVNANSASSGAQTAKSLDKLANDMKTILNNYKL